MDSIESARQIASDLHLKAIGRGVSPWNSLKFAIAEADRRDYDVEAVAAGATVLNGSKATLIADEYLILHENSGTEFQKAFLIAHEIGHIELGDTKDNVSVEEIDPARTIEASPIGIDRVVDYSAQQRREVQMDLFAREFLLPRTWVKKLHVDDGLTATEIAEKLDAPYEVVAQQLLDALLLPAVNPGTKEGKSEVILNEQQKHAADHRGKPYLLEAGPGTGKTQTLVKRVEGLLDEGVDPRRILILTFSNKAAGEMAERLASKNKEAVASMWIGTFHAFGLDLVRRFYSELGFEKEPRLLERTEAVEALEDEFPRLGLEHFRNLYDPTEHITNLLSAISRAKDEVVDHRDYFRLAQEMLDSADTEESKTAALKAKEVATVYEAYERLKRAKGCIDFGDLVLLPVKFLENNVELFKHFQSLYDHVLVDEYQDVNRSSIRLLMLLCGEGENLWAVGDARQSIYRFRGASSVSMSRYCTQDFPTALQGRLKINYRSSEEIIRAYSKFAFDMSANIGSPELIADRGETGCLPEFKVVEKADDQAVVLAETIKDMQESGYSYRDQAVLCSGNERLSQLAEQLELLGVPVLYLGSLFEREEVKDMFSFLSLLTDSWGSGLVRIGRWPEFELSLEDLDVILNHLRTERCEDKGWLLDSQDITGISSSGKEALSKLGWTFEGIDKTDHPWKVLATLIFDKTRIAARLSSSEVVSDKNRSIAIWQLMNFVRTAISAETASGLPVTRLLERVRRLLRLGDDKDLRQLPASAQSIDAVRLMTMHGAKGLEFKVVHLPGMSQGTLPRTYQKPACEPPFGMITGEDDTSVTMLKAEHEKEQECLFYVSMSRAQDKLFMYAPAKKSNNSQWKHSPFISRIQDKVRTSNVVETYNLPRIDLDTDMDIAVDRDFIFESNHLGLYQQCPRRYLYTHLLKTGGKRTKTSYVKLHDAVRFVVQRHMEEGFDESELKSVVESALAINGLSEHGYIKEFTDLACSMSNYFVSSRKSMEKATISPITLELGGEKVIVRPDDILSEPSGRKVVRRIRTGHARKKDDSVGTAAFILASEQAYPSAKVETLYLADELTSESSLTAKVLSNRKKTLIDIITQIRLGQFPAKRSSRSCPSCPAFFICGMVPSGSIKKKLKKITGST
ncbi:UvrD-helicase domain-containing protein [Vibrio parahaemolyticus]|uniref:DNA 3'-5' helicase n=5 Tax=Vibrio parahaemolyticus TaxID=670 RepID=Q87QR6_VIBPA|nr:UvrD-helicase domain-containing protein [Vibrio parahaemolyticus]EFO38833.1 UvrD/REP helicase [Vibrio parahaemolyticus Peru-466]EVU19916.1 uvrD/REP helicase N-terminal domain protein [Vibrio parahaemolyticus V-223/04]AVJ53761.1 DNA helicase UvrD [Vibrio parahaemolyticus]AZV71402.1 ImmA/IrrE family metallo-endopeptidase [Vibrio parahaemolyticus]EDM59432.1 UvrD/REP helicase [Vibrio parahaemolyticus AQ3810]